MGEEQQSAGQVFDVDAEIARCLADFDEQERRKREQWAAELSTRLDACLSKNVQNALNIVLMPGIDRAYATITRYSGNSGKAYKYAINYLEVGLWQIRRGREDGSIMDGTTAVDGSELLDALLLYIGRTERGGTK